MKFQKLLAGAVAALAFSISVLAQQPVKIGMSMPQTGALGAGGKAALLALQMWVEDVNAKGGLLGRKVEFIAYDDQTNPSLVPHVEREQRRLAAAAERAGLRHAHADLDGLLRHSRAGDDERTERGGQKFLQIH